MLKLRLLAFALALWHTCASGQDSGHFISPELELEIRSLLTSAEQAADLESRQTTLARLKARAEELLHEELTSHFGLSEIPAKSRNGHPDRDSTAIILPLPLAERLVILVAMKGSLQVFESQVGAERLRRAAMNLRDEMEIVGASFNGMDMASRQLHDWLVGPFIAELRNSNVRRLLFYSIPELRTIPMATLFDGRRYLVEDFAVAMTFGIAQEHVGGSEPAFAAGLRAGIAGELADVPARPGVAAELEAIASHFDGPSLFDEEVTVAALSEALATNGLDFIHLAFPIRFDAVAAGSSLMGSDGELDLPAFLQILDSQDQGLSLLTLSASDTPRRDPQAALSMLGIAPVTGIATVSGLWRANHEATALLMRTVYDALAAGQTAGDALRMAQMQMLRNPRFSHPSFWGGFQLQQ